MSRVERSNTPHDGKPHDEANCPDCQRDIAAMVANMSEVKRLTWTKDIDESLDFAGMVFGTQLVLASDYDALAAKVAELEKDAARYRWLRHGNDSSILHQPACEIAEGLSGHEWDRAIDTAMGFAAADSGEHQ